MTAQTDPYIRVYYSITDDEKFAEVYDDDASLATWLRLLIIADAMFPAAAPIPAGTKTDAFRKLVEAGLIDRIGGSRYRVHGLEAERLKRTESARANASKRWQSDRNATASGGEMRPHSDGNATAMRPHSDRISPSNATAMLSEPIRTEPSLSEPRHRARVSDELDRSGLPHITLEIAKEIEGLTQRPITTLHGTWAGELDRLVEERGGDRVVEAMREVCATVTKPSWPQVVAGARNRLEPLPGATTVRTPADARKAEISDAVRQLRAVR